LNYGYNRWRRELFHQLQQKKNKVHLAFKITQTSSSSAILLAFKEYFGYGKLSIDNEKNNALKYQNTDLRIPLKKIKNSYNQKE